MDATVSCTVLCTNFWEGIVGAASQLDMYWYWKEMERWEGHASSRSGPSSLPPSSSRFRIESGWLPLQFSSESSGVSPRLAYLTSVLQSAAASATVSTLFYRHQLWDMHARVGDELKMPKPTQKERTKEMWKRGDMVTETAAAGSRSESSLGGCHPFWLGRQ